MYLPAEFTASDPDLTWAFIESAPFGLLLDPIGGSVSHLPFLVGRGGGRPHRLLGHVAARNPVALRLQGARVTVVFTGPNAYVSPLWYEHPERGVPTWNYVAAQVSGTASILDAEATRGLLDELCARFEAPDGYRPNHIAPELLDKLVAGIVGFEIQVEELEGKLKLSQNRSPADRLRVMHALKERAAGDDLAVLEWMQRASS
jgi:transcriptional regulator